MICDETNTREDVKQFGLQKMTIYRPHSQVDPVKYQHVTADILLPHHDLIVKKKQGLVCCLL